MVHSSFLLALPLAHLGSARYLPWINNRARAAPMLADPVHESMSMSMSATPSMSHTMDDGMQMPGATNAPMHKRQAPVAVPTPSIASIAIASVVPASGDAPKAGKGATNFSIVSITVPTASAAPVLPNEPPAAPVPATPKASATTSAARTLPTAQPAPAPLPPVAPVAPGSPAQPAQPVNPPQPPQPVTPKSPTQPLPGQPIPAPVAPGLPKNPAGPVVVPIAPPSGPTTPVVPAIPAGPPPANINFDAALANGLDLNVLTIEAQFAASTDLLDMAQRGNPLDQTVYNVAKENLKTLQAAGARIRVNNMQLAKSNPKVLRTLGALQAEQAKEMELSSKLTGDATGDLSVLIQLQKMLATGIQKQSSFIEQSIPQQPGAPPRAAPGQGPARAQPLPAAAAPIPAAAALPAAPVPAAAAVAQPIGARSVPRPNSPPEDEEDE